MSVKSTAFGAAIISLFIGCGAEAEDSTELRQDVSSLEEEAVVHREACDAADSMEEMMGEMDRHFAASNELLDGMRDDMGMMGHCRHMADFRGHMSDVEAAYDEHMTRMDAADGLEEALAECERYDQELEERIEAMRAQLANDGLGCM